MFLEFRRWVQYSDPCCIYLPFHNEMKSGNVFPYSGHKKKGIMYLVSKFPNTGYEKDSYSEVLYSISSLDCNNFGFLNAILVQTNVLAPAFYL